MSVCLSEIRITERRGSECESVKTGGSELQSGRAPALSSTLCSSAALACLRRPRHASGLAGAQAPWPRTWQASDAKSEFALALCARAISKRVGGRVESRSEEERSANDGLDEPDQRDSIRRSFSHQMTHSHDCLRFLRGREPSEWRASAMAANSTGAFLPVRPLASKASRRRIT